MRKNWSSVHVAAAVAAPLLLGFHSNHVSAQSAAPEVKDAVATSTTEGAPIGGAAGSIASTPEKSDALNTASQSIEEAPVEEKVSPSIGDDALPSLSEAKNNPYIRANTAGLEAHGETSGGQEFGAFVPPTDTKAKELTSNEAGAEMRGILGDDVFDRRVNISTPPDTEVSEVIRLLADRANLNFVYSEGVIKGRVTLNLKDVPLGVALQSLLSSQDLAIVREGANVMRIAPRKEVRPGSVDTRTVYIKLNWVTAEELASTLKATLGGTSNGGVVQAHKESNTLIITDSAPNVALLRDLVAQLDVPEKQVMIEARMVELLLEKSRGLGGELNISRLDSAGVSPIDGVIKDGLGGSRDVKLDGIFGSFLTGSSSQLGFGTVATIFGSQFNIGAALDGLEDQNIVHTLANPRVITLNNQEANVDIIKKIPYIEAQQGVTEGSVAATVRFEDAKVALKVTPVITNNGYVRMKLEPHQKILAGFVTRDVNGQIPIIDERKAQTNVIVKDEDTVVLGGLRQISATDTKSEYPWLGRTPVLGWFFKNDIKRHTKNDLMLFVTPHIVKAPTLTAAENYKYSRIDAHWDLPDYFFDDSVEQREGKHRGEADQEARNYYPENVLLPPPGEAGGSVSAAGDMK